MIHVYSRRTDHFELYFSHRSAVNIVTKGDHQPVSLDGIHEEGVLDEYEEFFEAAWVRYSNMGFLLPLNSSRDSPCMVFLEGCVDYGRTGLAGPIDPTTSWYDYSRSRPIITVRNRQGIGGEFDHIPIMKATAAHELFHCIQHSYFARGGNRQKALWHWWMEASATYMESVIFPELLVSQEYFYKWFDRPDIPLDFVEDDHPYGGSLFCCYLAEQFGGPEIIREVWEEAASKESALEALLEISKRRDQVLVSSTEPDLFADGFAAANCLRPIRGRGYSEESLARLQPKFQHAFARKIIRRLPWREETNILDHLSSHYYYLVPPKDSCDAEVRIESLSETAGVSNIKATLLLVDPGGMGQQRRLVLADKEGERHRVSETIRGFGLADIAEAWLVVSNTATGSNGDSVEYSFSVTIG